MRRAIVWAIGIVVSVGAVGAVAVRLPVVQDFVMRQVIARRMTPKSLAGDDALRVATCGTASPLPHPTRAKACTAVFAGGRLWVVDTGQGSWNRFALWQVDARDIGGIRLTHFHSDHIGELGEFNLQTWVAGRPGPLQVFGPPGVERVVTGFSEAYALDSQYRIAHHGAELLPADAGRMEARVVGGPAQGAGPAVVLREKDLTITAFAVNHEPVAPAYGYRFDYRGRSVVVSDDTTKSASLIAAAKGADVLVHEAQANHIVALMHEVADQSGRTRFAKIFGDIPSYHSSPVEAAEAANEAGVKLLVLTHLTPPPPNGLAERAYVRGIDGVRPNGWVLADDGLLLTLPAGSDEITQDQL